MKKAQQSYSEALFSHLLKQLSAQQVKQFIAVAARDDASFRHRFIIACIEQTRWSSQEKINAMLLSYAALETSHATFFQQGLQQLLQKAGVSLDAGDFREAFNVAAAFVHLQAPLSDAARSYYAQQLLQVFDVLVSIVNSNAAFELKEEVYRLLSEGVSEKISHLPFTARKAWLNALEETTAATEHNETMLDIVKLLMEDNRSNADYALDDEEEEFLLILKMKLLLRMNRQQEVQHLMESHLFVKAFRLQLIDAAMAEKNFQSAKELIREGKRHEQRINHLLTGEEWDELSLRIAQAEDDSKAIRILALRLFLNRDFDFRYYYLLRLQYHDSRWPSQIDRIANRIRLLPRFASHGIHAVARIFIEERLWEKLLALLQKNSKLAYIKQYAPYLRERFPQPLLELYRKSVRREAEKAGSVDAYHNITDAMCTMQSLPDGKEMVQALAIELKVTYRKRRSFVAELNKLAL